MLTRFARSLIRYPEKNVALSQRQGCHKKHVRYLSENISPEHFVVLTMYASFGIDWTAFYFNDIHIQIFD